MHTSNIYTKGVLASEVERLQTIDYPGSITEQVLSELEFASFIDAGAGPSSTLAEYVAGRDASYAAFDIGKDREGNYFSDILRQQLEARRIYGTSIYGDVYNIPDKIGTADVAFQRFVLMHLPERMRGEAVENLLAIANRHVVLMEYDWSTIRSTSHPKLIQQVLEIALQFMEAVGIDPFAGGKLKQSNAYVLDDGACSIRFGSKVGAEGHFSSDLIMKFPQMRAYFDSCGRGELSEELSEAQYVMEHADQPVTLVPARIAYAVITK